MDTTNHHYKRSSNLISAAAILCVCFAPNAKASPSEVPSIAMPPAAMVDTSTPHVPNIPFIASAMQSPSVEVTLRSTDKPMDRLLIANPGYQPVITTPTKFYVEKKVQSDASKYAYAITRGSQLLVSAEKPLSLENTQIKIQHRIDTQPGLRSGTVQLWIWGIDPQGRVSPSLMRTLIIAGDD